jgi:hypothetical protein
MKKPDVYVHGKDQSLNIVPGNMDSRVKGDLVHFHQIEGDLHDLFSCKPLRHLNSSSLSFICFFPGTPDGSVTAWTGNTRPIAAAVGQVKLGEKVFIKTGAFNRYYTFGQAVSLVLADVGLPGFDLRSTAAMVLLLVSKVFGKLLLITSFLQAYNDMDLHGIAANDIRVSKIARSGKEGIDDAGKRRTAEIIKIV